MNNAFTKARLLHRATAIGLAIATGLGAVSLAEAQASDTPT